MRREWKFPILKTTKTRIRFQFSPSHPQGNMAYNWKFFTNKKKFKQIQITFGNINHFIAQKILNALLYIYLISDRKKFFFSIIIIRYLIEQKYDLILLMLDMVVENL